MLTVFDLHKEQMPFRGILLLLLFNMILTGKKTIKYLSQLTSFASFCGCYSDNVFLRVSALLEHFLFIKKTQHWLRTPLILQ